MSKFRILLLFLLVLLLLIHFVFKDRFHSISVLFYAFPLHLILTYGIFVTLLYCRQKRSFYILFSLMFTMAIYFFANYFGSGISKTKSTPSAHILFWNVAKKEPLPTDILTSNIEKYTPEIIALVEARNISESDMLMLQIICPEHEFRTLEGAMLIGVKGTIENIVYHSEQDVYEFNYIAATIRNKRSNILMVDVYASPLLNKKIPISIILNFIKEHPVDIMVGDFNTPYESIFFNDFNDTFNSFHPYSIGLTSTWPTPIPLIEIDQIWIDKSYQPIQLKKFRYEVSDHKLLVAEFE